LTHTHVLHVVPTLRAGGMEMALSRIVNGLLKEGVTHSIVVLKGDPVIKDLFDPSVSIHCLDSRPNDPQVPLRLRRLIRQERPTVIHARNFGAWPEIALARLTVWPWVPLVLSFHGVSEPGPPPLRWRLVCCLLVHLTRYVFAVSHGAKQYLTDLVGLPASRIDVIPNGVDTARFYPVPKPIAGQGFVIGTLGSLTPIKNQALLVRACHRLIQEGFAVRLEIAGEGPERPALESLIQSLGLGGQVRLIGHIADTPAFLHGLDMFVLPSNSEAHPNALSEAMACGLPCMGSRVGGIPEILDHGKAGLLFEAGNETGLADAIKTLLNDAPRRQGFGEAAWKLTCERYSMEVMLRRYRELYLSLSGNATS